MRYILTFALFVIFAGCQKSSVLRRNQCTTLFKSGENVSVCPEKITVDGRCPEGVECIWQGYAILQCRFTKNQESAVIFLSTLRHPAVNVSPDTTLMGYRVELISLTGSRDKPEAEIKITSQ